MTLADAIARARALQAAADQGWPEGYEPAKVNAEAAALLRVFEAHATTSAEARAVIDQLEELQLAW
ncbi:MAG: hypothetical protein HY727_15045 [Candidatus Rokubacteria bacterium]|nr:hypothetical protein [Candidatus Rokubacteria bacterium]